MKKALTCKYVGKLLMLQFWGVTGGVVTPAGE